MGRWNGWLWTSWAGWAEIHFGESERVAILRGGAELAILRGTWGLYAGWGERVEEVYRSVRPTIVWECSAACVVHGLTPGRAKGRPYKEIRFGAVLRGLRCARVDARAGQGPPVQSNTIRGGAPR